MGIAVAGVGSLPDGPVFELRRDGPHVCACRLRLPVHGAVPAFGGAAVGIQFGRLPQHVAPAVDHPHLIKLQVAAHGLEARNGLVPAVGVKARWHVQALELFSFQAISRIR